jgi:methyl-accepting chemotaxis protein
MRLTLRRQITTAFILFGLVPALVVAWSAYQSTDDFKDKQRMILGLAATTIGERIARPLEDAVKTAETATPRRELSEEQKHPLRDIILGVLTDARLAQSSQVIVVDPENKMVLKRTERGSWDPTNNIDLDYRYQEGVKDLTRPECREFEASQDGFFQSLFGGQSRPAEVVAFAPIHLAKDNRDARHGYATVLIQPRREAYAAIYSNQVKIGLTLLIVLAVTATLGPFVGRWFIRPLLEIIEITRQLRDGHLHSRTLVKRGDELGELANQVNSVVDKLSEVISHIRETTASVSTASNELNSSAHQLAQGSAEQAATLQEIAGSLQSVDSSVGRNAQHAKETARMANDASSQAEKGGEAVRETVVAMREITQKILIVDDIAYQTNLLALNAAIEAARAGTHGKGFAVVAGEVRKLAERSQAAAQQISDLAKKSVAVAENAGATLDRTVPMIRDVSQLIQEIAAASQEQMNAIREINVGVSQLEEVVQQNAAASHQLSATATGLDSQSANLQQHVDFFQLDTSGNGVLGGAGTPPRSHSGAAVRAQTPQFKPLPAARRRSVVSHGLDGVRASGPIGTGPGHQPTLPALPTHAAGSGPSSASPPPNSGTPSRGGVVVNLDDDDNFERFS